MGDDLANNLEEYKTQLQQVEAALLAEPDNDELRVLKNDLVEVIQLTQDLVDSDDTSSKKKHNKSRSDAAESVTSAQQSEFDADEPHETNASSSAAVNASEWKVGDKCLAFSAKGHAYYEAKIDDIEGDTAVVTFSATRMTEICDIVALRSTNTIVDMGDHKRSVNETKSAMAKKMEWQAERERRKKKNLKKKERLKQQEEAKEADKKKWKDFNTKAKAKSYKGFKKAHSIFASPGTSSAAGRVGVMGSDQPQHGRQMRSQGNYIYGKGMESLF